MKIIYFTTACQKDDYVSLSLAWRCALNTSIQNLNNRLIRMLGLTHEVEVISFRPFSRKLCSLKKLEVEQKLEGKVSWHYAPIKRHRIERYLAAFLYTYKLFKKMNLKDAIVITETLNPKVLDCAKFFAKKYNLPIVGVCYNTPSGISGTNKAYTTSLLEKTKNLNGFITTTPGLNDLFNPLLSPSLTFPGVLENKYHEVDCSAYGQYFYYDGSLEEKFGIYELIEAFKLLNLEQYKLVISGYNAEQEKLRIAIGKNNNIIYLGNPSSDIVLSLINHAYININPRPFTEDFDRYLIPDNLIDYFGADNALTLTVKNHRFDKDFVDDVVWADSNDVEDLVEAIRTCLSLTNQQKEFMVRKAKSDAVKLYSMTNINRRTIAFLKQFLKQKD